MARGGERSRPPLPAPLALRPFLDFTRLDDRVGTAVRRALEDDADFRDRVRGAVLEASGGEEEAAEEMGEAGWLLLGAGATAGGSDADRLAELLANSVSRRRLEEEARDEKRAGRRREQAEVSLARLREDLADERRRAEDHAATVESLRDQLRAMELELDAARGEVDRLTADRSEAVRQLDEARRKIEERAEERRSLRQAASAARAESAELRVELAHMRTELDSLESLPRFPPARGGQDVEGGGPERRPADAPDVVGNVVPGDDRTRDALARAMAEAADAAAVLGSSLERASLALAGESTDRGAPTEEDLRSAVGPGSHGDVPLDADQGLDASGSQDSGQGSGSAAAAGGGDGSRQAGPGSARVPVRREPARLPMGIFDDSAEAAEHLVRLPGAVLVVDGYNVSMAAWPEESLAHQRRHLVGRLRNLQARTGVEPVAVFDGADVASGPTGSLPRSVQVRFSPPGVIADDVVVEMVDRYPNDRAVVVATSDRELRARASAVGANLLSGPQLIGLLGG